MSGPSGKSLDRIEALERDARQLRIELAALARREAVKQEHRHVRIAKTCVDTGSYPAAPADTFAIKFCDGSFPLIAGDQTAVYGERNDEFQTYAHSICGKYWPEGSIVMVEKINRQWWIFDGIWQIALSCAVISQWENSPLILTEAITLNKRAGFRLLRDTATKTRGLIDLGGGPVDSLFHQGASDQSPRFNPTPTVAKGLMAGSGADGFLGIRSEDNYTFHLMTGQAPTANQCLRLPEALPTGLNTHLVVTKKQAGNLQAIWSDPCPTLVTAKVLDSTGREPAIMVAHLSSDYSVTTSYTTAPLVLLSNEDAVQMGVVSNGLFLAPGRYLIHVDLLVKGYDNSSGHLLDAKLDDGSTDVPKSRIRERFDSNADVDAYHTISRTIFWSSASTKTLNLKIKDAKSTPGGFPLLGGGASSADATSVTVHFLGSPLVDLTVKRGLVTSIGISTVPTGDTNDVKCNVTPIPPHDPCAETVQIVRVDEAGTPRIAENADPVFSNLILF